MQTISKARQVAKEKSTASQPHLPKRFQTCVALFVAGAFLALSAPGFEQWYLAWFGLVPLLAGIFLAKSHKHAVINAMIFGAGYTLLYTHFILSLQPFMGIGGPQFIVPTRYFYWLFAGLHQSLFFGIFAFLAYSLPQVSRISFEKSPLRWLFLMSLAIPFLWVLTHNKLGAQICIFGIPWTLLEYSQYKQIPLLQCASLIGGIGIGGIIVLFNLIIFASLHLVLLAIKGVFARTAARRILVSNVCTLFLLVAIPNIFGLLQLNRQEQKGASGPSTLVSIVQGVGSDLAASTEEEIGRYLNLCRSAPAGICVWPEWALYVDLPNFKPLHASIKRITREEKQSWLIGSNETDNNRSYNVACAFNSSGKFLEPTYRKQIRVPFGEYVPALFKPFAKLLSPQMRLEPSSGNRSVSYELEGGRASPILCFEVLYPELTAEAVRNGSELVVDLSCITWFTSPVPGQHLIAASALRAVETSRYLVYATSTGPSAILAPSGRIVVQTPFAKSLLISRLVTFRNVITPFMQWYR